MDGAPAGTAGDEGITHAELRLAARNHGLPLEALRQPITPAGLHYLLIHYDIPAVDSGGFGLEINGAVERRSRSPSTHFRSEAGRQADHLRVRREWPGSARAPPDQPALADGGRRHRGMGRRALAPLLEEGAEPGRSRSSRCSRQGVGGRGQTYERSLPIAEAGTPCSPTR